MDSRYSILVLALAFLAVDGALFRNRGVLPPGPVPEECCRVFCPPKAVCVCCFLDYDYHDGINTVHSNGIPKFLRQRHGMTKREALESIPE